MPPTFPDPRPSRTISVRLPAVLLDALQAQLPADAPSLNAWISSTLHDLVDLDRLTARQRADWQLTARPLPRAGRRRRS